MPPRQREHAHRLTLSGLLGACGAQTGCELAVRVEDVYQLAAIFQDLHMAKLLRRCADRQGV